MPTAERKPRVMLVDDEPDFASLVRAWTAPDYELFALPNGERLLPELARVMPALLILDVRMPGDDGFELCRRVRAEPRFKGLPVLFLTGGREESSYLETIKSGGTAYLTKPVGRKQLLGMIRELVPAPVAEETTGTVD